MRTHRFGKKIKLPATSAIKHQIRMLMLEDALKALGVEAKPIGERSGHISLSAAPPTPRQS
jgi:hypothetical protein